MKIEQLNTSKQNWRKQNIKP